MRRRILGKDDVTVAQTLRLLAGLKLERGDYPRAEWLYREVLALQESNGIGADPERADTFNDLAVLLDYQGKPKDAEETFDKALDLWRRIGGNEHTSVAVVLSNKGKWLADQGRYAEATACYEQGLAIRRKRLGDRHPLVAVILYKLASLHNLQDHPARAEELARESADILGQRLPPGHWRKAYADSILGVSLAAQGRYAEAEPLLVASYPIVAASRGAQARPTQEIVESLVNLYQRWGRPEEERRYRALLANILRGP